MKGPGGNMFAHTLNGTAVPLTVLVGACMPWFGYDTSVPTYFYLFLHPRVFVCSFFIHEYFYALSSSTIRHTHNTALSVDCRWRFPG